MKGRYAFESIGNLAMDFVKPINPPTERIGARYIINVTYYLTTLAKIEPIKDCSMEKIV